MLEGCHNLFEIEKRLNAQLSNVTLLGQIPLNDPDTQLLRTIIKDELARDFTRVEQCGRLSFACFLVGFGVEHYDGGTYWTKVQNYLGQAGQAKQHQWGETFLGTLERYKLTIFPNPVGLKYVTPILLHGGIPDSDLPSFFGNVLYPVVSSKLDVEVSDAEQLVAEWSELYQKTDIPVQRFLEYGGKPAADFLSRCLEMTRATYSGEPLPSAQELGLPERIVQRFEQWWQGFQQPTLLEQQIRLSRPRIERDAWGEVRCVLPEQIIAAGNNIFIQLQITADGQNVYADEVPFYRVLAARERKSRKIVEESWRMRGSGVGSGRSNDYGQAG